MRLCRIAAIGFFCAAGTLQSFAQEFEFYPGGRYDAATPTLKEIVGHAWGEKISMHHEVERYITALADGSPLVSLVRHGETWEGRSLYYLVVASETNQARLPEIKAAMQRLSDPRTTNDSEAASLFADMPAITWLAYGVHGNEISSTDAGLLTAYHLAAAQNDTLRDLILSQSVVIIDPLQNPDGRDRFVNYYRQTRGRWPDPDQQAAEHREGWPGGRTNHYLFDMNRDWFAMTQPETKARVQAYLEWFPQVFVDLHEMGSNSTYYFAPPADPLNPEMPAAQIRWLQNYGRNNARWFDKMGFDYFTREVFDSFYPGYGEGWPILHGAVGMTYEQASARGLVVDREDKTTLHYRESVQHHFISSLSTAETTARNRADVLRYFYDYRKAAVEEGRTGELKEYILDPGGDPNRARKLVDLLRAQGIEVKQAQNRFTNGRAQDYYGGAVQSKTFAAGTYVVSLEQPAKRLVHTLLTRHLAMDEKFIREQLRRQKKRLPNQIYDVTSWSLPLLYDVDCYTTGQASKGSFAIVGADAAPSGSIEGGTASVAYLIPWGTQSAAAALAELHRRKIRVFGSDKPLTLAGRAYPAGTLIIKVKNNPADLHTQLDSVARSHALNIIATNSSWVDDGVNFGSGQVRFLKPARIAMAYSRPVSAYSAGWTRFLIERRYGYPVTILHANQISRADLSKYNVLILPHASGGYSSALGTGGAIKEWIRDGGTLVTYAEATRWLTDEKVGLLATRRELKGGEPEKPADTEKKQEGEKPDLSKPFDVEKAIQPDKELPVSVPGALLRVKLDLEHWLAFGYDGDANVMAVGRNIYTPLKLDQGTNVGLFMPEPQLVLGGFIWEETQKQLANKAYLMHQRHGRGHVVAFAEDPNIRAFCDGLNLLLMNAIFLGPAH